MFELRSPLPTPFPSNRGQWREQRTTDFQRCTVELVVALEKGGVGQGGESNKGGGEGGVKFTNGNVTVQHTLEEYVEQRCEEKGDCSPLCARSIVDLGSETRDTETRKWLRPEDTGSLAMNTRNLKKMGVFECRRMCVFVDRQKRGGDAMNSEGEGPDMAESIVQIEITTGTRQADSPCCVHSAEIG